ncbi:phospholipid-translocating P-type ATPase [Apiospora arundinis]
MPPTSPYRATEPPDSPVHDSDSDADLDLQELDPTTASETNAAALLGQNTTPEQRAPRIALRNLRMGVCGEEAGRPAAMANSAMGEMGTRMPWAFSTTVKSSATPTVAATVPMTPPPRRAWCAPTTTCSEGQAGQSWSFAAAT